MAGSNISNIRKPEAKWKTRYGIEHILSESNRYLLVAFSSCNTTMIIDFYRISTTIASSVEQSETALGQINR